MKAILAKKLGKGFIGGVAIGYIITIFTSLLFARGKYAPGVPAFMAQFDVEIEAVVIQAILFGVLGAFCSGASLVFRWEKVELFWRTVINCISIFLAVGTVGTILKWFYSPVEMGICGLLFIGIYTLIWHIERLRMKRWIEKANKKLEKNIEGQ